MNKPNLLLAGYGRAGKDTFGMMLEDLTILRYTGSLSWHALPYMAKIFGRCEMWCWENRHKYRQLWKDCLDEYRRDDPLKLIKESLQKGEIVVGVRGHPEVVAARQSGLFHDIIWIKNPRVPQDFTVDYDMTYCTRAVGNDGSVADLWARAVDYVWERLPPEVWCAGLTQNQLPPLPEYYRASQIVYEQL